MPRYNYIQTSFLAGEISPKLEGRLDLREYLQSAKEITNGVVMPQGGVNRRSGTKFVASAVNAYNIEDATAVTAGNPFSLTEDVKLIPFNFSIDESYIVIIGHDTANDESWVAVYDSDSETAITSFTRASASSMPYFVKYNNVEELADIKFAQSADVLWITHPNHPPWVLKRTSATSFEIADLGNFDQASYRNIPFQDLNTNTSLTIATTGSGGTRTLTASSSLFTSDMVGNDKTAIFRLTDTGGAGTTHVFAITGFTSATVVTGTVLAGGTGFTNFTTSDWSESAWNGERGYPRAITLYEQRVVWGGTRFQPDTVWLSATGNFFRMDPFGLNISYTITASDAFNFTVASGEVNQIQWLSSGSTLNIGTLGREYLAQGVSGALSATNISVTPETAQGSSFVQPVRVENTLTFIERSGQRVREFIFNRDENAFRANDLTYLNDDAAKRFLHGPSILNGEERGNPRIVEMQFQPNDYSVLWLKNNYGAFFGITRNRERNVQAMHFHIFGGSLEKEDFENVTFNPEVTSFAITANENGSHDDIWLAIKRTINSNNVVYLEKISKELQRNDIENSDDDITQKLLYSDSAKLVRSVSPTNTFSGFSHLEGETVDVVADGGYVGQFTVSSGNITTVDSYTEIVAGLNYRTKIRSVILEAGSAIGAAQGTIGRIDRAVLRFNRTIGAKVGPDENNLDELYQFRNQREVLMDDPTPLFTGDIKIEFPGGQRRGVEFIVVQDLPLPMQFLSGTFRGQTFD